MKVAIIGAGAFGTALGGVLASNGFDIDYYDTRVENERLSDVLTGARAVVLCVPSASAPYVLPHLPKDTPLIVATKGILTDAAFDEFADWMVLSGPGFAGDIKRALPTHLTATDERVIEMFETEYLDFDLTDDRRGVLMCGALKNVYALWAGYLGLRPVSREHRQFLHRATEEMAKVLEFNGARGETVRLNCGYGDLKITCGAPSRNYEYGQKLQADIHVQPDKTVEGLSALKRIRRGEIDVPTDAEVLQKILCESEKWGKSSKK